MRRRDVVKAAASAAAGWPLAARAQQSAKLKTIGFLGASSATTARAWVAAFEQRLAELGWQNGRTVVIDYRWADGRVDRATEIAATLAAERVDVIVTYNTPAILTAKRATATIPIVFALGANPVATGIVASLGRPGGNVTGLATSHAELIGKKIEIMREINPRLARLAIMANAANQASLIELREAHEMAGKIGIEALPLEVRLPAEIDAAVAGVAGKVQGLYVVADALMNNERVRLATLSLGARLPTMFGSRDWVAVGGLMSYGANFVSLFRRSGDYVDKILRGARPMDLPVEQPTRFDLIVNLTTAKALGLSVTPRLHARIDEAIE